MKQSLVTALLLLMALGLLVMASQMDYEAELDAHQFYCDMRKAHIESNGQYGWPKLDRYAACAIEVK